MRMMKVAAVGLVLALAAGPALASYDETKAKVKGASAQAMEHASENSIFNRTADWFVSLGKSPEEKRLILAERRAERAAKRAKKAAGRMKTEAQGKAKELKDKTDKQANAWK